MKRLLALTIITLSQVPPGRKSAQIETNVMLHNRSIKSELRGFQYDRAQYNGGAENERPEHESAKTWQNAARKKSLISVHDFCRTPEAQPFNPVPGRIYPHQTDTHSDVKCPAEESD
jgi:hypothetical protein